MGIPVNEILVGDAAEQLRSLPAQSVHCVVTSPPYFRLRDYGVPGQIGLEASGEEYLERMVQVLRQVRRVLRKDGTVWLNMGDSYVGGGRGGDVGSTLEGGREHQAETRKVAPRCGIFGLKEKQLIGMPWRLALALQADGWWLRQDNIWAKRNVMPESIRDRTTRSHEYIFQLARSGKYFYDAVGIEEPQAENERTRRLKEHQAGVTTVYRLRRDEVGYGQTKPGRSGCVKTVAARYQLALKGTRNKRSVWSLGTQPFKEAHFATFPEKLVEPCILAGTSAAGCCQMCGAPFARVIRPSAPYAQLLQDNLGNNNWKTRVEAMQTGRHGSALGAHGSIGRHYETIEWRKSCRCQLGGGAPCIVLDPFMGAGTTALVALKLGRRFIGIELNPEYATMARRRLAPFMPEPSTSGAI